MNTKSGKQMIETENVSYLSIFRYKDNTLYELEDQVGVESAITVNLDNGNQITLPCTAVHLEELALGIAFSQNLGKRTLDDSISPSDPISYEKVLIRFKEFCSASLLFRATGSVHSGQLMDADYNVLFFTEDMGRHNVIDKIIGFGLKNNIDFNQCILMISSRMPLELVEKAYKTGIKNIASVSAPTKNAVLFARAKNINLIG
ncbi:MAG TPA: formate dehydrogenase accessory sulfurtransferase FdhD, partial [Anaerovoracaceae bacterium]|nr:formate dehydrogenase accessory sulfurtransferase FdhD [Anaerovoracaceae bacterium]